MLDDPSSDSVCAAPGPGLLRAGPGLPAQLSASCIPHAFMSEPGSRLEHGVDCVNFWSVPVFILPDCATGLTGTHRLAPDIQTVNWSKTVRYAVVRLYILAAALGIAT